MLELGAPHNIKVREAPLGVLLGHVVSVSPGTNHINLGDDMFRDGVTQNVGIITTLMMGSICNNTKHTIQSLNSSFNERRANL